MAWAAQSTTSSSGGDLVTWASLPLPEFSAAAAAADSSPLRPGARLGAGGT
jgi:hypothetical protein